MGGATSFPASVCSNLSAQAARPGVLPASMSVTPNISRSALNQNRLHPSARSRYPTESPAKKSFPSEHWARASSMSPITASAASSFSALSSSVAARRMPNHAGNSLSST
uniref:Predicted protein n=1 Tax=Hordeum vulgare subsp. vulgare TaxID=112509 RepID=F2DJK9_HORVV|nr:predicted protein [Hordeum vulgare subsp. vulgare]